MKPTPVRRVVSFTKAKGVEELDALPVGGGIYIVTAEPTARVLYVGRTRDFRRRGFARHHKAEAWRSACTPTETVSIVFATMSPELSPRQLGDVEVQLIRRAAPPCNDLHVRS